MAIMKTAKKIFFLICVLMLTVFSLGSLNASLDTKGTDFWIAFPGNLSGGGYYQALFITSDVNTSGTVDIPGTGFSAPFNVTANTVTTVTFPSLIDVQSNDAVTNLGIHVTSLQEVTVYGLNRRDATTDAYLSLPLDILGTDYLVLGYMNVNIVNANQFLVVATANGTAVTITTTVTVGGRIAGVPYVINMNQGETYLLRDPNGHPSDLSGTKIVSNLPIGVYGGHQCANIPFGYVACDHIVEMIPPNSTFGKNFLTVPLATRLNGDVWRIMASDNTTTVTINGAAQPVINSGQYIETILTGNSTITSDKPVLVAQYSPSSSFDGITSDPFMMLIPPFEQFLAAYTVTTPASGFAINFINVVAPNAVVGTLTLDGVPVPVINFTPIGVSGYSGAQLPVNAGTHNLAATLPFGCFVYGFDSYDSYGYPGGQALSQIAIVSSLYMTPRTAINPINTQHCVDALVKDQNNVPLPGIRVDFERRGVNPGAGFAFTNTNGIANYCYAGANAGLDTIIGTTGSLKDTVFKTWESAFPVELSSFTSTVSGRNVILNWTTAQELNNMGFDIERKLGDVWAKAGYVAGNGTTTQSINYEFTDKNLASGKYNYRLKQIDFNGSFEYFNLSNEVEIGIPDKFSISQNYPNPFNPSTCIDVDLPIEGRTRITVFDNSGKIMATLFEGLKSAGSYTVEFKGTNLSSGVYYYRVDFNADGRNYSKVLRMTLVK
jgi:hypothetical protein